MMEKLYQACKIWKQVGVSTLILDKADFKWKSIKYKVSTY
jgi:hypothetical protein